MTCCWGKKKYIQCSQQRVWMLDQHQENQKKKNKTWKLQKPRTGTLVSTPVSGTSTASVWASREGSTTCGNSSAFPRFPHTEVDWRAEGGGQIMIIITSINFVILTKMLMCYKETQTRWLSNFPKVSKLKPMKLRFLPIMCFYKKVSKNQVCPGQQVWVFSLFI